MSYVVRNHDFLMSPPQLGALPSIVGELVGPVMVHFMVKPMWSKQGPVRLYLYRHWFMEFSIGDVWVCISSLPWKGVRSPVMLHFRVKPFWSRQGPVREYLYRH